MWVPQLPLLSGSRLGDLDRSNWQSTNKVISGHFVFGSDESNSATMGASALQSLSSGLNVGMN